MSNPVHVFVLLALIVFWIGPASCAGRIAERKGRSLALYTITGLIIGPIVLLAALILPRRHSI